MSDDFEGITPPIPELPLEEITRRLKNTHREIGKLAENVTAFVERDTREHAEMRSAMTHDAAKTSNRIEAIRGELGALAIQSATVAAKVDGVDGKLDMLHDHITSIRRVEETKTIETVKTEGAIRVIRAEDVADAAASTRKERLALIGIVGTLAAGIATMITMLAESC